MNYERVLEDSFDYTKNVLWGRWLRWLQLMACIVVFPLMYGYFVRIMRGDAPAPDPGGWGRLFLDGLKLLAVYLVYVGFMLLVAAALMGGAGIAANGFVTAGVALVSFVLFILIWLVVQMAAVRFAKAGSLREAFNIPAVLGQIHGIGWGPYILSQVILQIVLGFFVMFLAFSVVTVASLAGLFAGIMGFLLLPILLLAASPPIYIFQYRYNTLVYESGGAGSGMSHP